MTDTLFEKVTFYLGLICIGTAVMMALGQQLQGDFDLSLNQQPPETEQKVPDTHQAFAARLLHQ